jgi:hypothetical protein
VAIATAVLALERAFLVNGPARPVVVDRAVAVRAWRELTRNRPINSPPHRRPRESRPRFGSSIRPRWHRLQMRGRPHGDRNIDVHDDKRGRNLASASRHLARTPRRAGPAPGCQWSFHIERGLSGITGAFNEEADLQESSAGSAASPKGGDLQGKAPRAGFEPAAYSLGGRPSRYHLLFPLCSHLRGVRRDGSLFCSRRDVTAHALPAADAIRRRRPAPTQTWIKRRATAHSSLSTNAGATWDQ